MIISKIVTKYRPIHTVQSCNYFLYSSLTAFYTNPTTLTNQNKQNYIIISIILIFSKSTVVYKFKTRKL